MATCLQTVNTDSFSMDYFRFGHGDRALVTLPGLSVQSVMDFAGSIAEAYESLANDFTVYVFDRRRALPAAYAVRDMARDTAEALRALGLRRVDLFGASQGGMIAMCMAVEQPKLVRRLVLGSTAARVDAARYRAIDGWVRLAKSGDAAGLYLAFGEAVYPRDVFERSRESLLEAAKAVTDEDLKRFVILAEGARDFDVLGDMDRIMCPTLVIGSRDDRVLGAEASAQIAKRLNGRAELHMYDGFGHAAYDTAPDFKDRMRRFLMAETAV